MLFDNRGRIVDYNGAAIEALETSREEIHFSSFISFLTNRKKEKSLFAELESEDSIVDKELEVVTKKGNVKTFLVALNTIRDFHNDVVNYQVIFKDITKRNASQKLLLKTIIETQENERERIARDLHDGLGQTLAAIKLNLDAVKDKQALSEGESERIEHLIKVSTKQLREICFNALPNVLSELGLVEGIEELVTRTQSDKLTINFKYTNTFPKIYKSLEVAIYRIVQEFLNNSIKHSEAKQIEIALTENHDHIVLDLSDNGKGFVVKDMMIYSGQGLKNIKSRVNSFNGDLEITSEINQGTTFIVTFPVN